MKRQQALARTVFTDPAMFVAFGFGAGLSPRMPGTCGTLIGIPLFLVLRPFGPAVYAGVLAVLFLFGVAICGSAARRLGIHDPGGIVWDEIVGFGVTMLPLSHGLWGSPLTGPVWAWIIAGFVLFRILDIAKPGPIGVADRRVSGGLGIMLDDLVAGILAAAVLAAVRAAMAGLS